MSNLEAAPGEVEVARPGGGDGMLEVLEPRGVPLGGVRAMTVRRTLPQKARTLIGAWCFLDHYGPDDVAESGGMRVPPHPHTGLQTVTWLFEGEIEHRDSVGSHELVRPGEVNLMTAGRGISHSEVSTPAARRLHGAQLWVALPARDRGVSPSFEHHVADTVTGDGWTARVFVGSLAGVSSPVRVFSPLVAAQIDVDAGATAVLPLDPSFEHGVLLDTGDVRVDGSSVASAHLAVLPVERETVSLTSDSGARILLIGGVPLGESLVMWWNFIGESHDDVAAFRETWQTEAAAGGVADGRFGAVEGYDGAPLPAPVLPAVRLRPRH